MCVLVCVCVLEAPGGINRNLRVVGLSCGNGGKRHPCAAELDWSSRCDTGFTPLSRFDLSGAFGLVGVCLCVCVCMCVCVLEAPGGIKNVS